MIYNTKQRGICRFPHLLSAILIVDNDIYEYLRELQHRQLQYYPSMRRSVFLFSEGHMNSSEDGEEKSDIYAN